VELAVLDSNVKRPLDLLRSDKYSTMMKMKRRVPTVTVKKMKISMEAYREKTNSH
jgi:hypothetical protein